MAVIDWNRWDPVLAPTANEPEYCQPIYELAQKFKPLHGLEIGVRYGRSALAFLLGSPNATLKGFDPNPEFEVVEFLEQQGVGDRFSFYNEASPWALDQLKGEVFDWIYIDGLHDYRGVYLDFEATWPLLVPGGVMVFDDYSTDLGYGTDVKAMLQDNCRAITGRPFVHKTMADFGLAACPHESAILIKEDD